MKVRFLRNWRQFSAGTVHELSEFDIIRLSDLGVIKILNGEPSDPLGESGAQDMPEVPNPYYDGDAA